MRFIDEATEKSFDHELLEKDEEYRLIKAAQGGDKEAETELIRKNQKLVGKYAMSEYWRGMSGGQEFSDLMQSGNIGLLTAIRKFDTSTGNRLSTYATPWIVQAINRNRRNTTPLSVSVNIVEMFSTFTRVKNEMTAELGQTPTLEEISKRMGKPLKRIQAMLKAFQDVLSLDEPVFRDDSDSATLGEMHPDSKSSIDDFIDRMDESDELRRAIENLRHEERFYIEQVYFENQRPSDLPDLYQFKHKRTLSRQAFSLAGERSIKKLRQHFSNQP